jgi:hypothetical protein
MSKEFKMSVGYRHYMLNLLVKNDSSLAEVSLVGMLVGDDYEILDTVGDVLHLIDFGKVLETPRDAQIAFSNFLADGGAEILDRKIAGEPEAEVEAEPVKAPAKKRAPRKKKA